MTKPPCTHGQTTTDRRCVTECFGDGAGRMLSRCMLCGAVQTYRVIDHDGPVIERGPWSAPPTVAS
jgi:hypothetical protein